MRILKNVRLFSAALITKQVYRLCNIAKIVNFKPNSGLTDDDINSLFLGLVNLVKNTTTTKVENYYRKEINYYLTELDNYALKVVKLENEVKRLNKLGNKVSK